MRRVLIIFGGVLTAFGVLAVIGAFARPWASYRIRLARGGWNEGVFTIFDVRRGTWFIVALLMLLGIAGVAALGSGRARQIAGLVAPVVGLIAAALVVGIVQAQTGAATIQVGAGGRVQAEIAWASGAVFGLIATPLLGFGGALLAIGRTGSPTG
jgi:hypothetical protein